MDYSLFTIPFKVMWYISLFSLIGLHVPIVCSYWGGGVPVPYQMPQGYYTLYLVGYWYYSRPVCKTLHSALTHVNRRPPPCLPPSHLSKSPPASSSKTSGPFSTDLLCDLMISPSSAAPPSPLGFKVARPAGDSEPSLTARLQRSPKHSWLAAPYPPHPTSK